MPEVAEAELSLVELEMQHDLNRETRVGQRLEGEHYATAAERCDSLGTGLLTTTRCWFQCYLLLRRAQKCHQRCHNTATKPARRHLHAASPLTRRLYGAPKYHFTSMVYWFLNLLRQLTAELYNRRIIIFVLLMVLILPVFEGQSGVYGKYEASEGGRAASNRKNPVCLCVVCMCV